jgi:vacuolar-type H+-ATPase subunit H
MSRSADCTAGSTGAPGDRWAPVSREALAGAHAQADALRTRAREHGALAASAAHTRADELRRDTVAAAQRAADEDADRVLAAARARARGLLLAARRDVYATVVRDVAEQASSRRDEYEAMRERLIGDARRRLGASVEISDAPEGGIIARAPGRQIDYSLSARLRLCLAQMGEEVAALWS